MTREEEKLISLRKEAEEALRAVESGAVEKTIAFLNCAMENGETIVLTMGWVVSKNESGGIELFDPKGKKQPIKNRPIDDGFLKIDLLSSMVRDVYDGCKKMAFFRIGRKLEVSIGVMQLTGCNQRKQIERLIMRGILLFGHSGVIEIEKNFSTHPDRQMKEFFAFGEEGSGVEDVKILSAWIETGGQIELKVENKRGKVRVMEYDDLSDREVLTFATVFMLLMIKRMDRCDFVTRELNDICLSTYNDGVERERIVREKDGSCTILD